MIKRKPKKLKKIPADLVSYIQIETEAIRDFNDKQMISSYCLSKLETVRDQLMECHREIMRVKIKNPNDRPIIDIKYPRGYEG